MLGRAGHTSHLQVGAVLQMAKKIPENSRRPDIHSTGVSSSLVATRVCLTQTPPKKNHRTRCA